MHARGELVAVDIAGAQELLGLLVHAAEKDAEIKKVGDKGVGVCLGLNGLNQMSPADDVDALHGYS